MKDVAQVDGIETFLGKGKFKKVFDLQYPVNSFEFELVWMRVYNNFPNIISYTENDILIKYKYL